MSAEPNPVMPKEILLYESLGFRLLFYPSKTKGPTGPSALGWTKRSDSSAAYTLGDNVGVHINDHQEASLTGSQPKTRVDSG